MFAGDSKELVVTIKDEADAAVSLEGVEAIRWHLSRTASKRPATVEKALNDGIAVTDETGGVITITLDPEDTEDLKGDFYHEVEIVDEDGDVSTVLTGRVTINPTLIKPA